ncbi:major facilitator superfamily domain-containing protein [Hyaloraphidium curvatum]|nr:major facilitator superfamily domain-containing protein [Hyaloraphidium curvatum]
MFGSFLVLNATLASSAPSGVATLMAEYFDASHMQVTLIISLFVLGYVVGPLIWAPLSEVFGRRPVYMISFAGYTAFNLGCALATTIGEMLAFRFLAGTFAAAPITNSGGVLTDIWEPKDRGRPMAYFGLAPFAGPVLGPAISGFMGMRFGSHQPLFWLLFAFSGVCFVALLWMPETYGPVLLRRRAERLREETGRTVDECRAPIEASGRTIGQVVATSFARPLSFLATELIVSLVTLYTSFVYGVLYLLFGTFPIVFVGIYHFNPGQSGIAFLSIGIGAFFSILVLNRVFNALYLRRPDPHGRLVPEWRLPSCFVGGPLFALSMFWFGWTANPSIHWIVPALAGIPMGAGVVGVFTATQSYLADCYGIYAASAIAANTVARSTFGFAFPLFSQQMYGSLGVAWASTVLGFAGLALVPVPFLFFRYGERIRARSKFARS